MSTFEVVISVLNIFVIVLIPLVAVIVGQKLQDKAQRRKDKLDIFKTLMMNRAGWSVESVRAMNIIDVVFVDDFDVKEKWKCYYEFLCIQQPNDMQIHQRQIAQYKLLESMAKVLGYQEQITWEMIQNPYVPQGMVDAIQQQQNIQAGYEQLADLVGTFHQKMNSNNSGEQDVDSEMEQD